MQVAAGKKPIPESFKGFLNFTVGDAFCRDRYLSNVTHRLHQLGIVRLGQLVALSEDEVFSKIRTTRGNQERLKHCLKEFGLELGMDVSGIPIASRPGLPASQTTYSLTH